MAVLVIGSGLVALNNGKSAASTVNELKTIGPMSTIQATSPALAQYEKMPSVLDSDISLEALDDIVPSAAAGIVDATATLDPIAGAKQSESTNRKRPIVSNLLY